MKQQKLFLARLRKGGKTFEIILDPNKIEDVVDFKEGRKKDINIDEVLYVDEIFVDARNAERAPEELLSIVFITTDVREIALRILKEGQVEIPIELRRKELEEKYKRLVSLIAQYGKDPRTGLPIPPQRVENALQKVRVNIKESIPVEFQVRKVMEKLQSILPVRFNKYTYELRIPPKYVGRVSSIIYDNFLVLRENWLEDGSWIVLLDVLEPHEKALLDYLTGIRRGEIEVKKV